MCPDVPRSKRQHHGLSNGSSDSSSDQVCELATSPVPVDLLVKFEGMSWSLTPSTMAGESLHINLESECILPVSVSCTEPLPAHSTDILECEFPPCLPLPSPNVCSHLPVLSLQLCPSLQDLHHHPYSPATSTVSPLTAPFQSVVSLDPHGSPSIISAVDLHPDHPAGGSCLAASASVSALVPSASALILPVLFACHLPTS